MEPAEIIINEKNGCLTKYDSDEELVSMINKALKKNWNYIQVS